MSPTTPDIGPDKCWPQSLFEINRPGATIPGLAERTPVHA